jgi:uncharacterized protein (TIGR03000 family)
MTRRSFAILGLPLLLTAAPAAAWELGGPLYQRGPDPYPTSHYGYNLDDPHPGYYGGINYKEYYNFGRGYGLANFPGPLPSFPASSSWRSYRATAAPSTPPVWTVAASLEVHVPAEAEIWFDGARTQQSGAVRVFVSPPLPAGKEYVYEVQARWKQDGRDVVQRQEVAVRAGQRVRVDFVAGPELATDQARRDTIAPLGGG